MNCFVLFLTLIAASTQTEYPLLRGGDLKGWSVSSPQYYDGSQLYGYINGGAEVYREYGFSKVAAQTLERAGHEVQVDVYRMTSPAAAFGMYSISRSRCGGTMKSARWSCITDSQVQFCRGPYYVNITAMDRTAESRDASRKAADVLISRMKEKDYVIPGGLPAANGGPVPRYVHGPLALAQTASDWLPLFDGIGRFDLYLMPDGASGATTLASVTFTSARDAKRFLTNSGLREVPARGTWVDRPVKGAHAAVMLESDKRLRYVESRTPEDLSKAINAWKK